MATAKAESTGNGHARGTGGVPPTKAAGAARNWEAGLEATLAWAEEEHGGPLADDVALMLVAGAARAPGTAL